MTQEAMNIRQEYDKAKSWQEKAILMGLFHNSMCVKHQNNWNMKMTASHFGVSMGLVSENIRLAKELDGGEKREILLKTKSRDEGLKLIERRKYPRDRVIKPLVKE